jgi:hypothetical protein
MHGFTYSFLPCTVFGGDNENDFITIIRQMPAFSDIKKSGLARSPVMNPE